jgi:LCP family protein required for cell wall assembly
VLFAVPIGLVLVLAILVFLADPQRLALQMFEPGVALAVTLLILLAGAWRLVSMFHAGAMADGRRAFRGRPVAVLGVLAALAIATHLGLAAVTWGFHVAGQRIFVADDVPGQPAPGTTPLPGQSNPPDARPTPDPAARRINILLTGIDSSESRNHALTDTLIVVSIDRDTGAVAMVSFPRDIARFPLVDGRTFNGKINSLMTYAGRHPAEFPDGPMASVTQELGFLLGIDVQYYAAVNLAGFERMVDEVGGVTIVNSRAINDPTYGGWRDGRIGFYLPAGQHTLDGATALAYARSRKGAGDNDFTRARRQQQLLVALQAKLTDPAMLPRMPAILDAAAGTITTNFPPGQLGEMLQLGRGIEDDQIERVVLGPPYATHPPTNTTGGIYILKLDLARVAEMSVKLFGDESRYAAAGKSQ